MVNKTIYMYIHMYQPLTLCLSFKLQSYYLSVYSLISSDINNVRVVYKYIK